MIRDVPRTLAAVVFDFDGVIFDSETPEYRIASPHFRTMRRHPDRGRLV